MDTRDSIKWCQKQIDNAKDTLAVLSTVDYLAADLSVKASQGAKCWMVVFHPAKVGGDRSKFLWRLRHNTEQHRHHGIAGSGGSAQPNHPRPQSARH